MLTINGNALVVDSYAIEVYLPADYMGAAYQGVYYYVPVGAQVKYLAVGNIRIFSSKTQYDNPDSVPVSPLAFPMVIVSEPSDIDTRSVKFVSDGRARDCIVLTYMRGDKFMVTRECIKNPKHVMMVLARLTAGKFDHLPPTAVVDCIRASERVNGVNLRIPSEDLEIFVAERYRDPSKPGRHYRYASAAGAASDNLVSHNMRTDAMQSSTYQGVTHEDINAALITSSNRHAAGVVDNPGPIERVVRGLSLDDLKEADSNNKFKAESMGQ